MEKTLSIILMVAFFLIGGVCGHIYGPEKTITETVKVPVNVTKTVTQEVQVANTSIILDKAVQDFLAIAEDDDLINICNGNEYDFDEISVVSIGDDYTIKQSEDTTEVKFDVKLKYKESDLRSCRESYSVFVIYEDGEDTVVELD